MAAAKKITRRIALAGVGMTLAAGFIGSSQALAAACPNADSDPSSISVQDARQATLCLLNNQRTSHGLRALRENRRLDAASQRHADDMAQNHYFDHGNFVGRIKAAHYLVGTRGWVLGENIAWGTLDLATPAAIVDGWMHSPPHRANILNRSFREIGIGVAPRVPDPSMGSGATYATDFGARL